MHEKVLNTTNHQGNANQNCNDILHHTCYDGYYQKIRKKPMAGEFVKKIEPLYTVGGNVKWCSHYANQWGGSSKH